MCRQILGVMMIAGSTLFAQKVTFQMSLPPGEYADTEVVTNVPFSVAMERAGDFSFSLSFNGTSSNNVEVAFGIDSNANGVLSVEETEMTIAWDCGEWKVCKDFDEVVLRTQNPMTNLCRLLAWKSRIDNNGIPSLIEMSDNGQALFTELPREKPSWVYNRAWDVIRLTGRGIDVLNDRFEVAVTPEGLSVIFR